MRTTVTLEADVEHLVKALMVERGIGFKQAINHAIRLGLSRPNPSGEFHTPEFSMGLNPTLSYDHALRLAGELEDDELTREIQARR